MVPLHSIPWKGWGSFPAGNVKVKPKDIMQTWLKALFVAYEMEGMEIQLEICARLHVSSSLSKRALLACSASTPALSDASPAALID